MLQQIHPLDYEKIKYTCSWLINLLAFSEEGEDCDANKAVCNALPSEGGSELNDGIIRSSFHTSLNGG